MKYNAVLFASFVFGQSAMATNIYRPPTVGHFQARDFNGSQPYFPSGTGPSGGFPKPTKKPCNSTGKAKPTAITKPTVLPTSDPASTLSLTTTVVSHLSSTVVVTVTPTSSAAAESSVAAISSLNEQVPGTSSFVDPAATSTSEVAPVSTSKAANSLPPYPTTFATSGASSTIASTGFASSTGAYPSGTGVPVKEYYQCGGVGYTGSTTCVEGSVCKVQNPYYSQCVDARFA